MTVPAHVVAAELRRQLPDLTDPRRLHKLLYYCQGYHLAWFGQPLFEERISAWDQGPVVGALWNNEKYGREPASYSQELDTAVLNTVGFVISRYGSMSVDELIARTHGERPWAEADKDREPGTSVRIRPDTMTEFFRAEIGEPGIEADALHVFLAEAAKRRDEPREVDDMDELRRFIATV